MAGKKNKRLSQIARELNVGLSHLVEYLQKMGKEIEARPNERVSADDYEILLQEFSSDKDAKKESEKINTKLTSKQEEAETETKEPKKEKIEVQETEIKIDSSKTQEEKPIEKSETDKTETEVKSKPDEVKTKTSEPETTLPKVEEKTTEKQEEVTDKQEDKNKTEKEENNKEEEKILSHPIVLDKIDLDALDANKSKKEKSEEVSSESETKVKPQETETTKEEPKKEKSEKPTLQELPKETPQAHQKEAKKEIKKENNEKDKKEGKKESKKTTKEDKKTIKEEIKEKIGLKITGHIDLASLNQKTRPKRKTKKELEKERKARRETEEKLRQKRLQEKEKLEKEEKEKKKKVEPVTEEKEPEFIKTKVDKLSGPTVVGKIDLSENDNKKKGRRRKKRKRIKKQVVTNQKSNNTNNNKKGDNKKRPKKENQRTKRPEIKEEDINKKIHETLAKLEKKGTKNTIGAKNRRKKREKQQIEREIIKEQELANAKKLEVTEFISANELANLMEVNVNEVIKKCFELGKMVSINQRLDADTIYIVAEEFGMEVEFVSLENKEADVKVEEENEADLKPRPPIVTVMGHVDHGKTSLLDFIRNANVIAGEAGGITQHIGAYSVEVEDGKTITFLDTPGHEAFTAMRARGAKVTDLVIIIIAADDDIMPQTEEAISHTMAADVPMIFAINKIDKPNADPQKIKQKLAERNLLIEDWGGKYQSVDIAAKHGKNVDKLLEEVLLAAEILELRANPNKNAEGTVLEASLDKGRGYVANVLISAGTLKKGDIIRSGAFSGRVKAMYNERDREIESAGPSEPVMVLGLNGAPIAGDPFVVMDSEREARDLAQKYGRIKREQNLRARKHITLDEIGRRIKVGNFKQLNVIIKSDVIGSSEALAGSFIKLSTEEIQVNIIHKGIGQISEADVTLAAASDAIIVGFQIRPSLAARKLAEQEEIDIRTYSVIYDAIEELKAAMEGMLSPEIKEEIKATLEVREVFKISKVGSIAGCYVMDGKITRKDKLRVIRDGVVVYTGEIDALKRFKDDVKEVGRGYECGLSIENFNDIKKDDIIESFVETEVAKKL